MVAVLPAVSHAVLPSLGRRRHKIIKIFKTLLSFLDHYSSVHLLDIEWLLSTLFDASLLKLRAAGNGGSFFFLGQPVQPKTGSNSRFVPR
jgi:hypothetical protein